MPPKILPIVFLVLSACATTQETSRSSPSASYVSPKAPDAVTSCLADGLGFLVGGPSVNRSSNENLVTFDTGSYAYLVISVRPESPGSRIDVHHRLSYPAKIRRTVEGCV